MLLSEAILLGSVSNGQAFGNLKDEDGNTCAMGAAMEACGHPTLQTQENKKEMIKKFPYLLRECSLPNGLWYQPIVELLASPNLWNAIASLNNEHKWTRPQIAAWVAEQEAKLGVVDTEAKQVSEVENALA